MLLKANQCLHVPRRFVQALFVTKHNAKGNVISIYPKFDLNRLENRSVLEENVKRRGLADQIDIENLYKQWNLYKDRQMQKSTNEQIRDKFSELVMKFKKNHLLNPEEQQQMQNYKEKGRILRADYKQICDQLIEIEDQFKVNFLALPNQLLANTPDELEIVYDSTIKPTDCDNNHLSYLRNDAAKFDLDFSIKCVNYFRHHDFKQVNNPDFSKTVVIEGSGITLANVFEIPHKFHDNCTNLVHLVGSGSWLSFIGFITKIKVSSNDLPLRFVSAGKIYQPKAKNERGLYDVAQSSAVQLFLAGTKQQIIGQFRTTLDLIENFYKSINVQFRIVHVPAKQLQMAECFAARIEMYSPALKEYVEVGNLSHYSNYISNRLLIQCDKEKAQILSGTICNVTKLIAILLETHNGNIPKTIIDKLSSVK